MSSLGSERSGGRALTLVDVYDIAADIGKEFEEIIDHEGAEKVTRLMQKVITALEHLEVLVQKNDTELLLIEDLRRTIEHLQHEEQKKSGERIRYARDIEQVEEHFKQETKDYLTTIKRLQEENRKLSASLTAATERDSAFSEDESFIEIDLVNKLQSIVEKQRNQMRSLDTSLMDIKSELDEVKGQNEKLSSSNRDLRRRLRQSQSQLSCLVDERAELQVALQDQQREASILARRLGIANKENEDLARSSAASSLDNQQRIILIDSRSSAVPDLEDPNRPRFTLAELKDILQERNSLKARVSDLEDELEVFRPGTRCPLLSTKTLSSRSHEGCDCAYHAGEEQADRYLRDPSLAREVETDSEPDCDSSELPVQGPLPYEPEDAPWKRAETSGIRKFFRRIFGSRDTYETSDPDNQGSTLRTSFSRFNLL